MRLSKYENNPVLSPNKNNPWESLCVCNPGAWYENGKFYLMYRASGTDEEHFINFGLAESNDGFNFKRVSDKPILSTSEDGPDAGCMEDARIVKFEDTFFITYAFRPFPPGQYWKFGPDEVKIYNVSKNAPQCLRENITNSGLLMTKDLRSFKRLGRITKSNLDDRDVILFPEKVNGKFVMLHRPKQWTGKAYGTKYPAVWISFSDDLLEWGESKLLFKGIQSWEEKVGGCAPPMKTDKGWLTLYHGVDQKGIYRVGVMLLDLDDPLKVIARASDFILEPEFDYEFEGLYKGCVFPTGNVIADGTLYVYYGGADRYCCMATCNLDEMLSYVLSFRRKVQTTY